MIAEDSEVRAHESGGSRVLWGNFELLLGRASCAWSLSRSRCSIRNESTVSRR